MAPYYLPCFCVDKILTFGTIDHKYLAVYWSPLLPEAFCHVCHQWGNRHLSHRPRKQCMANFGISRYLEMGFWNGLIVGFTYFNMVVVFGRIFFSDFYVYGTGKIVLSIAQIFTVLCQLFLLYWLLLFISLASNAQVTQEIFESFKLQERGMSNTTSCKKLPQQIKNIR